MNYLIEAKDGTRSRITADQAAVCEQMPDVVKETITPTNVLFRLKGQRGKCPTSLKYGGRSKQEMYNL
jgi:hypothetical protein